MSENTESMEDRQILQEIALNERIITHPRFGAVRLKFPTLPIQRKIDAASRLRKKELRSAFDEIEDPSDSSKKIKIPAYKSREALRKEYTELGWWSEDKDKEIEELSSEQINLLTELEILGFKSAEDLTDDLQELQEQLQDYFGEEATGELLEHILLVAAPIEGDFPTSSEQVLLDAATSTDVDDFITTARALRRVLNSFLALRRLQIKQVELQAEESSLFGDSWQEQLQYFTRIAQLFFCMSGVEDGKPLWKSLKAVEEEEDVDTIRWAYSELSAFWQGLSDEVRARMDKYNFLFRRKEEPESSDESLEETQPSSDGELATPEPIFSSEATDTTDLLQNPK